MDHAAVAQTALLRCRVVSKGKGKGKRRYDREKGFVLPAPKKQAPQPELGDAADVIPGTSCPWKSGPTLVPTQGKLAGSGGIAQINLVAPCLRSCGLYVADVAGFTGCAMKFQALKRAGL